MNIDEYKSLIPKEKPRQREYKLHTLVVKHLISAFPQVLFTHAGKAKSKADGMFLKKMGYRAGTPDLLLWWRYDDTHIKSAALELKAPGGSMSDPQESFEYWFSHIGGLFACCDTIRAVHQQLIVWGLKPLHGPPNEPNYLTKQEKFALAHDFFAPKKDKP